MRVRGAGETKEGLANLLALGAGVQSRCARATSRYRVYVSKYRCTYRLALAFAIFRTQSLSLSLPARTRRYACIGGGRSKSIFTAWNEFDGIFFSYSFLLLGSASGWREPESGSPLVIKKKEGKGCGFGSVPWAPSSGFFSPLPIIGCLRCQAIAAEGRSRCSQISSPPSCR